MNMQLLGDAQPRTERRGGGERREGGRGFGGERREGGRGFGGERREGGRGEGRRFSGERREGRAPRRDDDPRRAAMTLPVAVASVAMRNQRRPLA